MAGAQSGIPPCCFLSRWCDGEHNCSSAVDTLYDHSHALSEINVSSVIQY